MTKKDKIELLLDAGHTSSRVIAQLAGTSVNYVCGVRWRKDRPTYRRDWAREKRASNPEYYASELAQQREQRAKKRRERDRLAIKRMRQRMDQLMGDRD